MYRGSRVYEVPQKLTHLQQCTHILHNFWTSTHRKKLPPFAPSPLAAPLPPTVPCVPPITVNFVSLSCHRRSINHCTRYRHCMRLPFPNLYNKLPGLLDGMSSAGKTRLFIHSFIHSFRRLAAEGRIAVAPYRIKLRIGRQV